MKTYWWDAIPNFGDAIAPHLLEKFSHINFTKVSVNEAELITIGSVLHHVPDHWSGIILGSGRMYRKRQLHLDNAKVLAVRGPLTKELWPDLDCAIGDPGLLAPELIDTPKKKYDFGIVPHLSDRTLADDRRFHRRHIVINVRDNPLEVTKQIGQCRHIVSSSLHGLIVADAYGIPRRFENTGQVNKQGKTFKFQDYDASVGLSFSIGKFVTPDTAIVETRKNEIREAYKKLGDYG
jgi:Polysaccharide pyruvyl transferase